MPGGRERRRARARLRRQRRGRERRAAAGRRCPRALAAPERRSQTPGHDDDRRRSPGTLGVPAGALLKAFPVDRRTTAGCVLVARARRPPRQRDQARATRSARPFRAAHADEFAERIGPAGFIGPVGADVPILLDEAVAPGALRRRRQPARRAPARRRAGPRLPRSSASTCARSRPATPSTAHADPDRAGDRGRQHLQARHALLRAARRDLPRRERHASSSIWMGSYGIGPARIAAAAVEQFADEKGISWPRSIAPCDVELVALGKPGTRRARGGRAALRRAARRRARRPLRRPRRRARARSSPTPSCSAARCG